MTAPERPGRDWAQPPRIDHEIFEAYPERPHVTYGIGTDGMPKPTIPSTLKDAQAPDLLPETFVCMARTEKFVVRDALGRVLRSFPPDAVERMPDGTYVLKQAFPTDLVEGTPNGTYALKDDPYQQPLRKGADGYRLPVTPVRPACVHYARQWVDLEDDRERRLIARLCTARRTDDSEFLSVGNSAVYACELRSPPDYDGDGIRAMDAIEAEQIAATRRKHAAAAEAEFDVEKELEAEASDGDDARE